MTLKSITLHRASSDNTGAFVDAGADLTVGDAEKANVITADRARELLTSHGATGHYATDGTKKPSRTKAKRKPAGAPKAAEPVTPPPPVSAATPPPASDATEG